MHNEIDTNPDLTVNSTNIAMHVWTLERRVELPSHFASPELCAIMFPGEPIAWKISQLTSREREVDLKIACLNTNELAASFYNHNGRLREPKTEEKNAVRELERVVAAIIHRYGKRGTLV